MLRKYIKKNGRKIFRKNALILLFIAVILVVGSLLIYKKVFAAKEYVYAKVKLDQGYYVNKPGLWIIGALNKAKYDTSDPDIQIINEEHYPTWQPDQEDIYVIAKLAVDLNKNTGQYSFNHSTLSIGSPIQILTTNLNLNGTVIDLSNKPFKYKYIYKTVYLVDKGGYTKDFPYMYNSIHVGDKYFDGTNTVFEVLNKNLEQNIIGVQDNLNGQVYERAVDTTQNVVIKARVLVREEGTQLIYGEEYNLSTNNPIPFSTENFFLSDFVVRSIQ